MPKSHLTIELAAEAHSAADAGVIDDSPYEVEDVSPYTIPPLHEAVIMRNLSEISRLLDAGVSPNTVDEDGWTALHHAANACDPEACALLIKNGAFYTRNNEDHFPLQVALQAERATHPETTFYEVDGRECVNNDFTLLPNTIRKPLVDITTSTFFFLIKSRFSHLKNMADQVVVPAEFKLSHPYPPQLQKALDLVAPLAKEAAADAASMDAPLPAAATGRDDTQPPGIGGAVICRVDADDKASSSGSMVTAGSAARSGLSSECFFHDDQVPPHLQGIVADALARFPAEERRRSCEELSPSVSASAGTDDTPALLHQHISYVSAKSLDEELACLLKPSDEDQSRKQDSPSRSTATMSPVVSPPKEELPEPSSSPSRSADTISPVENSAHRILSGAQSQPALSPLSLRGQLAFR